jgi:hypothetical protein
VTTVAVTTVEVQRELRSSGKEVVIGLYPSITQPVHIAFMLPELSEDGNIGREEFAHDACENDGLAKLDDGDGVFIGGVIVITTGVCGTPSCEGGSMVITTGVGDGCAFAALSCEGGNGPALYVALSDLVSHDCEDAQQIRSKAYPSPETNSTKYVTCESTYVLDFEL